MGPLSSDRMQPWFERALDLSSRRNQLLSGNLANVDTPDYVPTDLDFKDQLRAELGQAQVGDAGSLLITPKERTDVPARVDGNQVDLDAEVVRYTGNKMLYELGTEVLSRRLAMVKYAIDEGGR